MKDGIHPGRYVSKDPKKQTNADRIRSMSDEELADMFHFNGSYVENGEPKLEMWVKEKQFIMDDSFESILDWLQSEVEG